MPFRGPSAAAFTTLLMSSYLAWEETNLRWSEPSSHKMSARGRGGGETRGNSTSVPFSQKSHLRAEMDAERIPGTRQLRKGRGRSGGCQELVPNTYGFLQTTGQVHHRDVGGWHAESHSSKFPVRDRRQQERRTAPLCQPSVLLGPSAPPRQPGHSPIELRDDLPHSLSSPSRCWDDVLGSTSTIPPQLPRGPVHCLLRGCDGMDSGLGKEKSTAVRTPPMLSTKTVAGTSSPSQGTQEDQAPS